MIPGAYALLILIAFGLTIWNIVTSGKPPLSIPVLLVIIALMLGLAR
jgi:hypothetical protein